MSIVTVYSPPPIPTNKMDWTAYIDGQEEHGCYGYGRTEQEAIADLFTSWPDEVKADLLPTDPWESASKWCCIASLAIVAFATPALVLTSF